MIDWEKGNMGGAQWARLIQKNGSEIRLSATLGFFWKPEEPSIPYLVVSWTATVSTQTQVSARSTTETGTFIGRDIGTVTKDVWEKHLLPTIQACERRIEESQ